MLPSKWIWNNAEGRAKKEHPLDPTPNPQDLLYATMEFLDNRYELANKVGEALSKKKGKK